VAGVGASSKTDPHMDRHADRPPVGGERGVEEMFQGIRRRSGGRGAKKGRRASRKVRCALGLAILCAGAACANTIRNSALSDAEDQLRAKRFPEALTSADLALGYGTPNPEQEARATLVKAVALQRLGQERAAEALYRSLLSAHAGTSAAYEARSRLAELLANAAARRQAPSPISVQTNWLRKPVEIPYPPSAAAEGKEGYAVLQLVADASGVLQSYEVLDASDPVFKEAAPRFELDPAGFRQKDRLVKRIRIQWVLQKDPSAGP
jgi:hypothetical protein